jgi:tRNA splicing ligase
MTNYQELELQKYLRGSSDVEARLAELEATTGIFHRRHKYYTNLVLLKYNMISSPMGEAIVQEARGLVLDQENNWEIVSRAFDKFFNSSEGHAAEIDWSTAQVQESTIITVVIMLPLPVFQMPLVT